MKSRRWLVLLGCLLAVAMLAALAVGCGKDETSTTDDGVTTTVATGTTGASVTDDVPRSILEGPQGPASGETPQYGGTLVILHQYGPSNFGAWWEPTRFMDFQAARFAVENLVGINPDGNPVPQLATSWEYNADFTEVTFHLREGVRFHDGTDFNAEAAKWNLQMQIDGAKTDLDVVTNIEVLDTYTISLTLSEPDPLLVQRLNPSGCGKMTSPAAYDEYGAVKIKRNPVGTGPFKLQEYKFPSELTFVRNDDYWQEGLPYLDAVKIVVIADYQSRKTAFLNGEGQIMYGANFTDSAELEAAGGTLQSRIMALNTLAISTDNLDPRYNDIRVRQAISYAIDVPTIVAGVYEGFVDPTNQLAIPGEAGWQQAAWNDDIVGYPYNPTKAMELLAEVGITPDNPWKPELTYLSAEDYDQVFTVVKDNLDKVGIEVSLRPVDFATWSAMNSKGWEGLGAMSLSYNPAVEYSSMLKTYFSEDAYQFGNHIFIPDEFNQLYRTMLVETDLDQRYALYRQLNKMAIDDYALVTPLYALVGNIAIAPEVRDNVWCVYDSGEYPVERIWLSQD